MVRLDLCNFVLRAPYAELGRKMSQLVERISPPIALMVIFLIKCNQTPAWIGLAFLVILSASFHLVAFPSQHLCTVCFY